MVGILTTRTISHRDKILTATPVDGISKNLHTSASLHFKFKNTPSDYLLDQPIGTSDHLDICLLTESLLQHNHIGVGFARDIVIRRCILLGLLMSRYCTRSHDFCVSLKSILPHYEPSLTPMHLDIALFMFHMNDECYSMVAWVVEQFIHDISCLGAHFLHFHNGTSLEDSDDYKDTIIGGGRPRMSLAGSILKDYMLSSVKLENCDDMMFEFVSYINILTVDGYITDKPNYIASTIPISLLSQCLTTIEMKDIAVIHNIWLPTRVSKAECIGILNSHDSCVECQQHVAIFSPVIPCKTAKSKNTEIQRRLRAKKKKASVLMVKNHKQKGSNNNMKRKKKADALKLKEPSLDQVTFPPLPPSKKLLHKIISNFCKESSPEYFEEGGCGVCGQLTLLTDLIPFEESKSEKSLLVNYGMTRKMRKSNSDPVEEIKGPVMDKTCNSICVLCENSLTNGKIPVNSLANGLWLGEVPPELQNLSFAERMLIARVRHNRCLVRVSSGRAKMIANCIMFSNPTVKVYHKLPPSKDELDEVLAFIFMGSAQPTEEEFKRTPMLVRRNRVATALEWLKLNHVDYTDLEISEDNLNSYPLEGVPVVVDYKRTKPTESNKLASAMSSHDNVEEEGTDSGPCPFSVHGMTGAEYQNMSINALKARALRHLDNEGRTLGVGQDDKPQTMYDNPQAYPQMFPWLFPYGLGGIGQSRHKGKFSEKRHKRHLLMYHDKRFQTDIYFPIIAFNHEQMKGGTSGSFLMAKRQKFGEISDRLLGVNSAVLADLSERMAGGERVKPANDEEQRCFDILDDLDHVGGHVKGSLTSKKYMRNEIWSLISFMGAPSWFITLSPADNCHPICLYYADKDIKFKPEICMSSERSLLIARNPVAAARFFDMMVRLFIKHVLGVNENHPGLYGETNSYYATVEQQGRLTLHLHMLLWIKGALSPQNVRDKLMDPESTFHIELTKYLEGVHVGEFQTGTMEQVRAKVPFAKNEEIGIHTILKEQSPTPMNRTNYKIPTLTLPVAPPKLCKKKLCVGCSRCSRLKTWWADYDETVDDLILRSNVHTCRDNEEAKEDKRIKAGKAKKKKSTSDVNAPKGCTDKDGNCSARFPREIVHETTIDKNDGYLKVKKLESMINTLTPALTYLTRCNTDVTSLNSGTSIKAIVSYISDYVTKQSLKTHQIFSSAYDVFEKNSELLTGDIKHHESARKLILKIVNTLSSKMEIGSPMASMYLLGNPDHYTSHDFVLFWWKSYVSDVLNTWQTTEDASDSEESDTGDHKSDLCSADINSKPDDPHYSGGGSNHVTAEKHINTMIKEEINGAVIDSPCGNYKQDHDEEYIDKVVLNKKDKRFVGSSNVDDYKYRPSVFESMSLYEWIQCSSCRKRTKKERELFDEEDVDSEFDSDHDDFNDFDNESDEDNYDTNISSWLDFQDGHPLHGSHVVQCDKSKLDIMVPNFVGGSLPRCDQGDREYYCCTMLTMFKPWRSGLDLKMQTLSWDDVFVKHSFTLKQQSLLRNFNLKYECLDARDDYYAILKQKKQPQKTSDRWLGNFDDVYDENDGVNFGLDNELAVENITEYGQKTLAQMKQMDEAEMIMRRSGWLDKCSGPITTLDLQPFQPGTTLSPGAWRNTVKKNKEAYLAAKMSNAPNNINEAGRPKSVCVPNEVTILNYDYFNQNYIAEKIECQKVITSTVDKFCLNIEQQRAFLIIANHASSQGPEQLKMYLGGMGGTGKSQVIKALIHFFNERNESHRFTVVAPTGTAAALLNGSTYHSLLGIRSYDGKDSSSPRRNEATIINEARAKLHGVEYVFLDEISMVGCDELHNISARLAHIRNVHDVAFGGMNVIFAGDFAQLPPVGGNALYAANIGKLQTAKMKPRDQENTMGKILWHQVTTVVILKENMRQKTQSTEDEKLRNALVNMRYGACTPDDIEFLRSWVAGKTKDRPKLTDPKFRNVSVITAWNSQKDRINDIGSKRFASDSGQRLITFYSVDSLTSDENSQSGKGNRNSRSIKAAHVRKGMTKELQEVLWTCPPNSSAHVASTLSLCIGMPIMIRNNDATELCITKGQEATVVGWISSLGPFGQLVLDTLFLKLVNPPRDIQIENLPKNIIPMTKTTTTVCCRLPNDTMVSIKRLQVLALPNFSMTDYASQGKTREFNVVDLGKAKNCSSYYTCLSRSSDAYGTIIVQGFDSDKITKGIPGYLRQEFRELNMLDEITRLRFENKLPIDVKGHLRNPMIRAYQLWRGNADTSDEWHPALQWKSSETRILPVETDGTWDININAITIKKNEKSSNEVLAVKQNHVPAMFNRPEKSGSHSVHFQGENDELARAHQRDQGLQFRMGKIILLLA